MKIKNFFRRAVPLLFGVLAAGCQNDLAYQHEAVERAREYLCKEARELSAEQMMFVRQNPPVLMHGDILGKLGQFQAEAPVNSEVRQICIAWRIPGADRDYLVFGRSEPRMQFWRPERLLRRRLEKNVAVPDGALNAARSFVITSMREKLSKHDLNTVRFQYPVLAEVNLTVTAEESAPQTALIWYLDDGKNAVAVLGKLDNTLKEWSVSSGGIFSVGELKQNMVKQIRSAKDYPFESTGKKETR